MYSVCTVTMSGPDKDALLHEMHVASDPHAYASACNIEFMQYFTHKCIQDCNNCSVLHACGHVTLCIAACNYKFAAFALPQELLYAIAILHTTIQKKNATSLLHNCNNNNNIEQLKLPSVDLNAVGLYAIP